MSEAVSGTTDNTYAWGLRYVDELLWRVDDTPERLYAMQDANFNCTSICDDTGSVLERYQFDPYGNRTVLNASWTVISSSSYNWTVGHQGLMFEVEVGLYNSRNRVYLPLLGCWMQRDPLGYVDGMSLYEYVTSTPLNSLDPQGLFLGKLWRRFWNSPGLPVFNKPCNRPGAMSCNQDCYIRYQMLKDCEVSKLINCLKGFAPPAGKCLGICIGGCLVAYIWGSLGYKACLKACGAACGVRYMLDARNCYKNFKVNMDGLIDVYCLCRDWKRRHNCRDVNDVLDMFDCSNFYQH